MRYAEAPESVSSPLFRLKQVHFCLFALVIVSKESRKAALKPLNPLATRSDQAQKQWDYMSLSWQRAWDG